MRKPQKRTLEKIVGDGRSIAGGGYALRAAYLGDRIHRGSQFFRKTIHPEQREWAGFLGFDSFDAMPIAHRRLVQIFIADWLLLSFYQPSKENAQSVREIRAALNSVTRLLLALSGMKNERSAEDIEAFIKRKFQDD